MSWRAGSRPLRAILGSVAEMLRPPARQSVWEWAEANVVFPESYPTARPGRYDSGWVPFWREPMEALTDPMVREVIVVKPAQAGGTENLLLNALRYTVARAPMPTMYVGGQQELTEAFLEERIKPGLETTPELRAAWRSARIRGTEVYFPQMMLAVTWASSVSGLKSRPLGLALADEISIWPEDSLDKLRARLITFPFSHMAAISAPDALGRRAAADDPIWIEFSQTDQRRFEMPDPGKKGAWFRFEMGSREAGWGLKWDQGARLPDGGWDLDRVRGSAYYMTRGGAVVRDADRGELLRAGRWVATRPERAQGPKRGYHLNAFYLPWMTFGEIAAKFLTAKAKGASSLRVFVCEVLAEQWIEQIDTPNDSVVYERQGKYERAGGQELGAGPASNAGA